MSSLSSISYTPTVMTSQFIADMNTDQSQLATLEQQLSSGKLINSPSDNPVGAGTVLGLNQALARSQQYSSNAGNASSWLSLGTSTANQIISTLQSVQQAVQGLSGQSLSGNSTTFTGVADEINSARAQLINLANTQYAGTPIFAGTGNATEAYDTNGNYVGGGSAPTRTVASGTQIPISVTGPQMFGDGTTSPDLLGSSGVLATLSSDVSSGNVQQAEKDLSGLSTAMTNVEGQAATLGNYYQQVQSFSDQATNTQAALQTQLSSVDSVNVAQASTQLSEDQQSFQSALWATSQVDQNSLVKYLG